MIWSIGTYFITMHHLHSGGRRILRLELISDQYMVDEPSIYARTKGEGIVIINLLFLIFSVRRRRRCEPAWSEWAGRLNKVPDGPERSQILAKLRQEARKCHEIRKRKGCRGLAENRVQRL